MFGVPLPSERAAIILTSSRTRKSPLFMNRKQKSLKAVMDQPCTPADTRSERQQPGGVYRMLCTSHKMLREKPA